ncbi:aldehyde dehydrogenase family protein [Peribacillus frigoritolerans]|uniref:aldehyde dehydrogenase family protein n=1 Tax=Peribacillus frigoritolerans TaxID=450367 RepID=UPI0039A2AE12
MLTKISFWCKGTFKLFDSTWHSEQTDIHHKTPVGVVAAITPWNCPLSMGARKLGPALVVGGTVILLPSREAPLSSLELEKNHR